MGGGLDPVVDALTTHYQAEKLKEEAATIGNIRKPDRQGGQVT